MGKLKIFVLTGLFSLASLQSGDLMGQFSDTFDEDLSQWEGDVGDFIINSEGMLQLNATNAGESRITTFLNFPQEWQMQLNLKMEFSPSDNNRTRIYVLAQGNTDNGSGYFLNIGENGSNDAIQLFVLTDGSASLLGSGMMGGASSDPVNLGIQLSHGADGFWSLDVDYEGGRLYVPDLELSDNSIPVTGEGLLIIECKYSSTRTDKFFFDNIIIEELQEDMDPPVLVSAEILNETMIQLVFNELLEEFTAATPGNYSIPETGSQPVTADVEKNTVVLKFNEPFISGPPFTILVSGLEDLQGNVIGELRSEELFYAVAPSPGDVIINEILFDPYPGEDDFIELYNRSDKLISLLGIEIHNDDREESDPVTENYIMMPGSYLALTPSPSNLSLTYSTPANAEIVQQPLPGFNNESGNVTLRYQGDILDAFNYHEDYHSPIINDTEGVSLERISPDKQTNDPENWASGQAVNRFATPGYQNGSLIETMNGPEVISLRETHFSPNGDGNYDYAILDYNLDKPGYLATIDIFNDAGQKVKGLANNVSLATNGFIEWDGITDEGKIGRIGVYIVMIELFHPDGDTHLKRFAVVLSRDVD